MNINLVTRRSAKALALLLLLPGVFLAQAPVCSAMSIGGTLEISSPLAPSFLNFLSYGVGNISLTGTTVPGTTVTIQSNNSSWRSYLGWSGVVFDQISFPTTAANTGGVFTADVAISMGGKTFAAVINPDLYGFSQPGSINTSGQFTGSSLSPDSFSFGELPVYAIVPFAGSVLVDLPSNFSPWDYSVDPYATDGTPQFSLAQVGTLSLVAMGGSYHALGTFTPTAPIPEPEQYVLMLAGLALIAFVAYRKRGLGIGAAA
jgi:hypothetical protein